MPILTGRCYVAVFVRVKIPRLSFHKMKVGPNFGGNLRAKEFVGRDAEFSRVLASQKLNPGLNKPLPKISIYRYNLLISNGNQNLKIQTIVDF